jgi:hypothetical protein
MTNTCLIVIEVTKCVVILERVGGEASLSRASNIWFGIGSHVASEHEPAVSKGRVLENVFIALNLPRLYWLVGHLENPRGAGRVWAGRVCLVGKVGLAGWVGRDGKVGRAGWVGRDGRVGRAACGPCWADSARAGIADRVRSSPLCC